jgi:perosamine synthetase
MLISDPSLFDLAEQATIQYFASLRDRPELRQIQLDGTGTVGELEGKLARHYDKQHALCFSNATTALLAIALALDLRAAEFITTPLTYGATLAGWLLLENRPLFGDLEPLTHTLCPESVRQLITPDTKAILAVDTFGNPCDTMVLREIADEHELWYIADAAQSFGARRSDLPASALADAIVVSFTVGKSLFAGEGGAIVTDNTELYHKLIWWSQHPNRQRRDIGFGYENQFGLNGRIHPLAAVIASATFEASLAQLEAHQQRCLAIVEVLNRSGLTVPMPFTQLGILPAFFCLTARWQNEAQPEELLRLLGTEGYEVSIENLPSRVIAEQPAFLAQYGHLSISEFSSDTLISAKQFALRQSTNTEYEIDRHLSMMTDK